MDTSSPPAAAGSTHVRARQPLTSSIAVTVLVILTSLLLETLTILLYIFASGTVHKTEQKVLVVVATVLLSCMAVAGIVLAIIDFLRRFSHEPPPEQKVPIERLTGSS